MKCIVCGKKFKTQLNKKTCSPECSREHRLAWQREWFKNDRQKKYLFATYSLAREGLDIPCLERLYMATPQKDYAVITQSIGRIARTADGKQNPVCFDFVDDIGYLFKSYKKRSSTYKKNGCYFVEEGENK